MKKKKFPLKFMFFLACVTILSLVLYFSSNKIMVEFAMETYNSSISYASYYAIEKTVKNKYSYEDLTKIYTDNNGQINMIVTNSLKVNELTSTIATDTFNYLQNELKKGVEIPLGAFTGVRLISGFGSKIKMQLISVSSVKCDILSEFRSAGINQVRHVLYLNVESKVSVVTKTATKTVSDKISILVYDNLIVGKVPDVFISSQNLGSGTEK